MGVGTEGQGPRGDGDYPAEGGGGYEGGGCAIGIGETVVV